MSDERPYTFIQWKGTEVCMDVYCTCGDQFHIDGDFAYEVQCHHCGQIYEVGSRVVLTPLDESDRGQPPLRETEYGEPLPIAPSRP
jgi:hypothetical protein